MPSIPGNNSYLRLEQGKDLGTLTLPSRRYRSCFWLKQPIRGRIVFDAFAREQDSVSLNDCVLPGPALQPIKPTAIVFSSSEKNQICVAQ